MGIHKIAVLEKKAVSVELPPYSWNKEGMRVIRLRENSLIASSCKGLNQWIIPARLNKGSSLRSSGFIQIFTIC